MIDYTKDVKSENIISIDLASLAAKLSAPSTFDGIEVSGVAYIDDAKRHVEVDNENPDFFSVYLHLVEGGVECIADFRDVASAKQVASNIKAAHGYVVCDYTVN